MTPHVGYALERLHEAASESPVDVDEVEVWLSQPGHPAMPTAFLATGIARVGSQLIRCRGVAADPCDSIDALCRRILAQVGTVPRQRDNAAS
ncbi:hypothetical protein [Haloechinothrix salitolerans]|uniref:Uncharacterized protein n=1 Tax=Haloechinothrix salitolerans TaxID=926830 RepID=A0ABW2C2S1_9PSEU